MFPAFCCAVPCCAVLRCAVALRCKQTAALHSTPCSAICHAVLSHAVSCCPELRCAVLGFIKHCPLELCALQMQIDSCFAQHSTTLLARFKVQTALPQSLQLCCSPQLDTCCLCMPAGSLMAAWQESNSHERGHLLTLITKTLQDISEEEAQALPVKDPESAGLHDKLSSFFDRCTGRLKLRRDSTSMTQRQRSSTAVSDLSSQV